MLALVKKNLKFKIFALLWVALFAVILLGSWTAWYIASQDSGLIYMPLRSYFVPIKVDPSMQNFSRLIAFYDLDFPNWLLAEKYFKPPFAYKAVHELAIWIIVGLQIFLFVWGFKFIKNIFCYKNIFILSAIVSGLAMFAMPIDSSDLFAYVARGAQQAIHGQNPYAEVVSSIPQWRDLPLFANCLWENNPAPYGPLFMLICKWVVEISFGNFWVSMLIFKFINYVAFLYSLVFLHRVLESHDFDKLKINDSEVLHKIKFKISKEQIFYLVALNPLIINETIWNGHNDYLMSVLAFVGVYLAFSGRCNLGILCIMVSAMIKYLSILILPVILLYAFIGDDHKNFVDFLKFKFNSLRHFGGSFFGILVRGLSRLPYIGFTLGVVFIWSMIEKYHLLSVQLDKIGCNLVLCHKSLYDLVNSIFKYVSKHDLPESFKYLFFAMYALFYLFLIWQIKSQGEKAKVAVFEIRNSVSASFYLLFVLIAFVSAKFHSWYVIIFLLLGVLAEPVLMLLFSITNMISFTILDQTSVVNYILLTALPLIIYFAKFEKLIKKIIS